MNITDELKERLKNAKTKEEALEIMDKIKNDAENAGIVLDEEDLKNIAGGCPPLIYFPNFI
ncbi:MAG: hypothetical protein K6B75_03365 [Lachnospiraceae bacterium]|nr:hypothetical protein [Lachnospiraceae bacterium]